MVNVYLHGWLGRKFGKEWIGLAATTVSEALHAIDINHGGKFRAYLGMNPRKEYKIKLGRRFIDDDNEVVGPCGKDDIHLLPVIKGRNSGWGKVFAAVAIVALMIWNPASIFATGGGSWGAFSAGATLTGTGVIAASTAAALAMGGVSQLLSPKVGFDATANSSESGPNSSSFGGNAETVRQGFPVPVAYGRVLINPLPISVSIYHEDHSSMGILPPPEAGVSVGEDAGNYAVPPNNPVSQTITVPGVSTLYLGNFNNTAPFVGPLPPTIPNRNQP